MARRRRVIVARIIILEDDVEYRSTSRKSCIAFLIRCITESSCSAAFSNLLARSVASNARILIFSLSDPRSLLTATRAICHSDEACSTFSSDTAQAPVMSSCASRTMSCLTWPALSIPALSMVRCQTPLEP